MLACFFCTKCDCYKDTDEIVYFTGNKMQQSTHNTELNYSDGNDNAA